MGRAAGGLPRDMYEVSYYGDMCYEKMLVEAFTPEDAILRTYRHANTLYMSVHGHGDYRIIMGLDGQVRVVRLRDWVRAS